MFLSFFTSFAFALFLSCSYCHNKYLWVPTISPNSQSARSLNRYFFSLSLSLALAISSLFISQKFDSSFTIHLCIVHLIWFQHFLAIASAQFIYVFFSLNSLVVFSILPSLYYLDCISTFAVVSLMHHFIEKLSVRMRMRECEWVYALCIFCNVCHVCVCAQRERESDSAKQRVNECV